MRHARQPQGMLGPIGEDRLFRQLRAVNRRLDLDAICHAAVVGGYFLLQQDDHATLSEASHYLLGRLRRFLEQNGYQKTEVALNAAVDLTAQMAAESAHFDARDRLAYASTPTLMHAMGDPAAHALCNHLIAHYRIPDAPAIPY